jgi:hypothetical protein
MAICWIATMGGTNEISLRDAGAWKGAADQLVDRISDGSVQVIGRDNEQLMLVLPGVAFASLEVAHPLSLTFEHVLSETTHASCYFFQDKDEWLRSCNDEYRLAGKARPVWTHLQVNRAQVVKLWPRPPATAKATLECKRWLTEQINESPTVRPKSKADFEKEALRRFTKLTKRQFSLVWSTAIEKAGAKNWSKPGRPRRKSNHCAQ